MKYVRLFLIALFISAFASVGSALPDDTTEKANFETDVGKNVVKDSFNPIQLEWKRVYLEAIKNDTGKICQDSIIFAESLKKENGSQYQSNTRNYLNCLQVESIVSAPRAGRPFFIMMPHKDEFKFKVSENVKDHRKKWVRRV